jgi:ATP-dependent helicase HrpA
MPAGVAVRLFATPEEAAVATRAGLARLFETQLRHDIGWLEKDLKALRMLGPLAVTLTTPDALQQDALASIVRWVTGREVQPLHAAVYARTLEETKQDLRRLVPKLTDWLKEIFTLRLALEVHKTPYPGMAADLAALLPPDFLRTTPFGRLPHLTRYLRGMLARAERWKRDAAKDESRAKELAPFVAALKKLGPAAGEVRWLAEEFRVSLFAQELGTAEPVSAVRLGRALKERAVTVGAGEPVAPSKPAAIVPVTSRKGAPLKSLGALDQLFRQ